MKKSIRFVLILFGVVISVYGAVKDYEPVTIGGAFLIVIGLMYTVILGKR